MERHAELGPWIGAWRGPLVGLIASLGVPWSEAVELAQDVFAEAWLARERFEGSVDDVDRAGAWLRGIAVNLARGWKRSRRGHADVSELDPPAPATAEDARVAVLREELLRLPEKERAALCMHYLDESSVRHVAALLGVPEKTVEGRLYRGRKLLRERMAATTEQAR